jgi:hypothetical protein
MGLNESCRKSAGIRVIPTNKFIHVTTQFPRPLPRLLRVAEGVVSNQFFAATRLSSPSHAERSYCFAFAVPV